MKYGNENKKKEVYIVKPIKISEKAYKKMTYYSRIMGSSEVGGMLVVREDIENKSLSIDDVLLFRQEVGYMSVTLEKEGIHEFINDMIKEGKDELINNVKGWWHSHGSSSTFWSSVDEDTISRWMERLNYFISVNTTCDGDILVRVDTKIPFEMSIDKCPYMIEKTEDPMYTMCEKELEKMVTKSKEEKIISGQIWDRKRNCWTDRKDMTGNSRPSHISKKKWKRMKMEGEAEIQKNCRKNHLTDRDIIGMTEEELEKWYKKEEEHELRRWNDKYDWY